MRLFINCVQLQGFSIDFHTLACMIKLTYGHQVGIWKSKRNLIRDKQTIALLEGKIAITWFILCYLNTESRQLFENVLPDVYLVLSKLLYEACYAHLAAFYVQQQMPGYGHVSNAIC